MSGLDIEGSQFEIHVLSCEGIFKGVGFYRVKKKSKMLESVSHEATFLGFVRVCWCL